MTSAARRRVANEQVVGHGDHIGTPATVTSQPSVARGTITVLTGLLSSGAAKAVGTWLIARDLGPAVQGSFSLCIAGMSAVSLVLSSGFEYANSYIVGGDTAKVREVIDNSLSWALCGTPVGLLLMVLFVLLLPQSATPAPDQHMLVIIAIAGGAAAMALNQSLKAAYVGLMRFEKVNLSSQVWAVLWVLVAMLAGRISYVSLLFGWTASFALACAPFVLGASNLPRCSSNFTRASIRSEQWSYGARTLPGSLARALNMRAALYLIAAFATPADVGVYGVSLMIAESFRYLPNAISQVVLGASSSRTYRRSDARRVYAMLLVAGSGASVVALLFGRSALRLTFGAAYERAALPTAILLAAVTIHAVGLVKLHELLGRGHAMFATRAQTVTLVVTVVAGLALTPRFGMLGGATSTLMAFASFTCYVLWRGDAQLRSDSSSTSSLRVTLPDAEL